MSTTERKLKMEWADQIEKKPIDWLWRPWLARGVVTVVDGELGVGKSSLLFDVIARVTTGRAFPVDGECRVEGGGKEFDNLEAGRGNEPLPPATLDPPSDTRHQPLATRHPAKVLLVALDDPVTSVVAPRLAAAGANLGNVVKSRLSAAQHPAPRSAGWARAT